MRIAWLVTGLLAVAVTWPLAADPFGAPLGHPGNDVWNHVWGYWWVAREIGEGRLPLRTDLMHFPATSRLFFIDTFGALVTLPVQWLAGPVAAYNTTVLGCAWAAGMGAWALARHVLAQLVGPGEDADRNALFAAAALQASPHLLAQAYNGITETLFAAGLPLATLAVVRLYERPGWARAGVAALAMATCTIANWYYGLFAAIGSVVLLVSFALARRERIAWARLPATLAMAATCAAALVLPVLLGFTSSLDGDDAIVQRDPAFVWRSLVSHNITDVVSLFRPGKVYSPDLKALHGEDLLIVTYLGWTLLAAAGLGLARLKRWRDRLPWLAWIGVFGVLMLGPYLNVGGAYVTVLDRRIPLPFLALYDALPFFQRISHPFRFVVPVQLGLAVLACVGLAGVPVLARLAAGAALLAECLLASPAPWPMPRSDGAMPAYVATLAGDPAPGAVVDLPIDVPNLERAVYLYWQTGHGRPSVYSLNEPLPELLAQNHLARALLVAESARMDRLPPTLPELDLVASGRALAELGVRYLVVHDRLYPAERLAQTLTLLRVALGPETTAGDGRHIWRIE
ncbi:MAG: hypothetical protein ACOZNI_01625 [Myxococcota bacterium]